MVLVGFKILTDQNVSAQTGQPTNGGTTNNWIIEEGDDAFYNDETIEVNGDLIIQAGGKLTLRNIELDMNTPSLKILVEENGELVLDSTHIFSEDTDPYEFICLGKVSISNCEIYNTYTDIVTPADEYEYVGGIQLYTSESIVRNTEIYNPYTEPFTYDDLYGVGITVIDCSPTILDNDIHHVRVGISYDNTVMTTSPCTEFPNGDVASGIISDSYGDVYIDLPPNVEVTSASFDIKGLQRIASQQIPGENTNDNFAKALDKCPDLNGDGYDEFIVGAPMFDSLSMYNNGKVVIYSGSETGVDTTTPFAEIIGPVNYESFGFGVCYAGNVVGDSDPEIVVSAPYHHYNDGSMHYYAGKVDIITVHSDGSTTLQKTIEGTEAYGYLGWMMSGVGDFNDDGYNDFIIGSPWYKAGGLTRSGKAEVYLGAATPAEITTPVITTSGLNAYEQVGMGLAGWIDINSDGYNDIAIGGDNSYKTFTSEVKVYFGAGTGPYTPVVLNTLQVGDAFGSSITGGDINGDDFDDLIVGAPYNDGDSYRTGIVKIYYGSETGLDTVDYDILKGEFDWDKFGTCVVSDEDINADGYDDIAITAISSDVEGAEFSKVYAYYGSLNGVDSEETQVIAGDRAFIDFGKTLELVDMEDDGLANLVIGSVKYDSYRGKVDIYTLNIAGMPINPIHTFEGVSAGNTINEGFGIGDHNGDGLEDYVICNELEVEGKVDVYFGNDQDVADFQTQLSGDSIGSRFGKAVASGDMNGDGLSDFAIGAKLEGDGRVKVGLTGTGYEPWIDAVIDGFTTDIRFGASLSVGDFNRDGYDDLVVGAPEDDSTIGHVYIYEGSATPTFTSPLTIAGEDNGVADLFGARTGVGDLDNDGFDDLVVSAYDYNSGNGKLYLYYGSTTGLPTVADETREGVDGESLGQIVSYIGDINSDGYDDLAVGSPLYGLDDHGQLYVFLGDESSILASSDWVLAGTETDEYLGMSVSCGGDLNGDGFSDFIIGDMLYDIPEGNNEGKVFICYGSTYGVGWVDEIEGTVNNDRFGAWCSILGDYNGDGFNDALIGTMLHDNPVNNAGKVDLYANTYPLNPSVDIGADDTAEWTYSGRLDGTETVSGQAIVDALNELIPDSGVDKVSIPLRVGSDAACKFKLENLYISYTDDLKNGVGNDFSDAKFGIIVKGDQDPVTRFVSSTFSDCDFGVSVIQGTTELTDCSFNNCNNGLGLNGADAILFTSSFTGCAKGIEGIDTTIALDQCSFDQNTLGIDICTSSTLTMTNSDLYGNSIAISTNDVVGSISQTIIDVPANGVGIQSTGTSPNVSETTIQSIITGLSHLNGIGNGIVNSGNIEIIEDRVYLANDGEYYQSPGWFKTDTVSLPVNCEWTSLDVVFSAPEGTYINYDIFDSGDNPLSSGMVQDRIDISSIVASDIYFNFTLTGNNYVTPILTSWTANFDGTQDKAITSNDGFFTIIDSTISNGLITAIEATGTSDITLVNSLTEYEKIITLDTSVVKVDHYLKTIITNADGDPVVKNVFLYDNTDTLITQTQTDSGGETGNIVCREYQQDISGKTFYTPIKILTESDVSPDNQIYASLPSSRTITLVEGTDSDMDLRPDIEESSPEVIWYEAENRAEGITDFQAFGDSIAAPMDQFAQLPNTGKIAVLLRMRGEPGAAANVKISGSTGPALYDQIHEMTENYRWYTTKEIDLIGNIANIKVEGDGVFIDRYAVIRTEDGGSSTGFTPGQVTDPLLPDTDGDSLLDGLEHQENTIWIEAENYPASTSPENRLVSDSFASNSFALATPNDIVTNIVSYPVEAGQYTLSVRARGLETTYDDFTTDQIGGPSDLWDQMGEGTYIIVPGYVRLLSALDQIRIDSTQDFGRTSDFIFEYNLFGLTLLRYLTNNST